MSNWKKKTKQKEIDYQKSLWNHYSTIQIKCEACSHEVWSILHGVFLFETLLKAKSGSFITIIGKVSTL